jgi:hypothetical protein
MAKYKISEKQLSYVMENLKIQSTAYPDDNIKTPTKEKSTTEIELETKKLTQLVIDVYKKLKKEEDKDKFEKELKDFLSKF